MGINERELPEGRGDGRRHPARGGGQVGPDRADPADLGRKRRVLRAPHRHDQVHRLPLLRGGVQREEQPAQPEVSFSSESVFEKRRDTTPDAYVVVNRFPNEKDPGKPIFVRKQCMHCTEPSCASACLCKAMEKMPEGPTVYHKDRCMGCRYCMISCPFDVPKFEYNSASPFVKKCIGCPDLVAKGEQTACAAACPGVRPCSESGGI